MFSLKSIVPSIISKRKKIICIGDLHGDYNKAIRSLLISKVIDKNGDWIAKPKNTIVVQVGDILDGKQRNPNKGVNKNEDEFKIIKLFHQIHLKASKHNGGVYCLMGNHEYMNFNGDIDWVSKKGIQQFGNKNDRIEAFKPGKHLSQMFAAKRNVIMKIGSVLLSHACILPNISSDFSIEEINETMRKILLNDNLNSREVSIKERCFDSMDGVIWSRYYSRHSSSKICKELTKTLENYNSTVLINGHSAQEEGIKSICNNKMFFVDVGMSQSIFNNKVEVLCILNNGKTFKILKEK